MVRFARRPRAGIPRDVAADLGLEPRERVLAWSRLIGGGLVAATLAAIRIRTPHGRLISRGWTDVDHAEWHAESGTLVIWWVRERQPTPLELDGSSRRLPTAVRDRVQSSVLLASQVTVPGGRTVRLALRRTAGGALLAQALPPPGVDLADAQIAETVRRALAELQAEAGVDTQVETATGLDFDNLHDA